VEREGEQLRTVVGGRDGRVGECTLCTAAGQAVWGSTVLQLAAMLWAVWGVCAAGAGRELQQVAVLHDARRCSSWLRPPSNKYRPPPPHFPFGRGPCKAEGAACQGDRRRRCGEPKKAGALPATGWLTCATGRSRDPDANKAAEALGKHGFGRRDSSPQAKP